jgi:hypothetical protein
LEKYFLLHTGGVGFWVDVSLVAMVVGDDRPVVRGHLSSSRQLAPLIGGQQLPLLFNSDYL